MRAIEENPNGVKQAEIVVGIPSYNDAAHIAFPTKQADKGLTKYFAGRSAAIISSVGDSPNGDKDVFLSSETITPKIYIAGEDHGTGKGGNLRNLFVKALELQAKAVIVLDADVTSLTPLWIRNLGEPLLEQYEFVAPLYVRHKYEGPITSNIAYPLTRALYGRRVRQPIGGDYGVSASMAKIFLDSEVWNHESSSYGVDMWMTTTALRNKVAVVQSFMGQPKIHSRRAEPGHVEALFTNVVTTIFDLMIHYESFWRDVKWSRPTAVYGFGAGEAEVAQPIQVDTQRLWDMFSQGLVAHKQAYTELLTTENIHKLEEVASVSRQMFEMPIGLWAKVLYDFSYAYKRGALPRRDIVELLKPLFHGRMLSFVTETSAMNNQQVEEFIEDQCLQFEKNKPYLLERWSAG